MITEYFGGWIMILGFSNTEFVWILADLILLFYLWFCLRYLGQGWIINKIVGDDLPIFEGYQTKFKDTIINDFGEVINRNG